MRGYKPELWTWPKFVRCTPHARLLFMSMWNWSCDNGHTTDDVLEIKMQGLPADNVDGQELIDEMVENGLLEVHDGYFKVIKLSKHQRIDLRYLTLCEHCKSDPDAYFSEYDRPAGARRAHAVHTASERRAPKVSTKSARGEGEGEGEGEVTTNAHRRSAPAARDARFEDFWSLYPRKVSKGQALKAWAKATKATDPDEIIEGLRERLPWFEAQVKSDGDFRPYPGPWLNGQRWTDEIEAPAPRLVRPPSEPYRYHDDEAEPRFAS